MNTFHLPIAEGDRNLLGGFLVEPATRLHTASRRKLTVEPDFDVGILSASTYPYLSSNTSQYLQRSQRSPSYQLYGGIVPDSGSYSRSSIKYEESVLSKTKTNRKARRISKSDDDDNGRKQRGRPRLDTRDETATDRRRTQIRLAQRAYRRRKENTISALSNRVNELEGTINQMNTTFLEFCDNSIEAGLLALRPGLSEPLQEATERFAALSKTSVVASDHEEEAIAELTMLSPCSHSPEQQPAEQISTQHLPDFTAAYSLGYEFLGGDDTREAEEMADQAMLGRPSDFKMTQSKTEAWSRMAGDLYDANAFPSQEDIQAMLPRIQKPLKISTPYTYSFQETTFARRLHRYTLETAYRMLTSPDLDPREAERTFRFTFTFTTKKQILTRLQEILKRKAGESLENWHLPFFRVGGAGTHFPRRDDQGNPIYPPNMYSPAKAFGPMPLIEVEMPRGEVAVEKLLAAIGFEGEWLDAHDVEGYLWSKGVVLNASATFVDISPHAVPLPVLEYPESTSTSYSGGSPHLFPNSPAPFDATRMSDERPSLESVDEVLPPDHFLQHQAGEGDYDFPPTRLDHRRPRMTIDVTKFLDRVVADTACLGRAPGFRRQRIDHALALAMQEAF